MKVHIFDILYPVDSVTRKYENFFRHYVPGACSFMHMNSMC